MKTRIGAHSFNYQKNKSIGFEIEFISKNFNFRIGTHQITLWKKDDILFNLSK